MLALDLGAAPEGHGGVPHFGGKPAPFRHTFHLLPHSRTANIRQSVPAASADSFLRISSILHAETVSLTVFIILYISSMRSPPYSPRSKTPCAMDGIDSL